jgi:transcriptional regulator with XRE-family HTH domain
MRKGESDLKRNFGRRLRFLRNMRGLTQEILAELVACSPEYISRIERGLISPSFEKIAIICKVLLVEPKELFNFNALLVKESKAKGASKKKV